MPISVNVPIPEINEAAIGDNLNLECIVKGYPKPDVKWTKNGEEIRVSDRILISGKFAAEKISEDLLDHIGIHLIHLLL